MKNLELNWLTVNEVQNYGQKWKLLGRDQKNTAKQARTIGNPQSRRIISRPKNIWRRSIHKEARIADKIWS